MTHNLSSVVAVYKPVGKTPLECVTKYRSLHRIDPSVTISYAGRLDPMAEGVLLLLVGEANKKRREYEHLSKEYEVIVLVGFATDTGDLMGKITQVSNDGVNLSRDDIISASKSFVGLIQQKYPIYSSAKVQGKPLYWWARQGRLNEIEIPTHRVRVDNIQYVSQQQIARDELSQYIVTSIRNVEGDFRQEEIIMKWQTELVKQPKDVSFNLFTLNITCGSGAYMRQLVSDIGERLNMPLVVFKIKRTKVGDYRLEDCVL